MNDSELLDKFLDHIENDGDVETQNVVAKTREIRGLMRVDAEFFIEFFLADSLDMPVPQFHKEIWGLATDETKLRILLAIPRDHAKTTLAKLLVVWHWLHTHHRFCVYLSNTNPIAKGACKDIIEFLSHPNFIAVYGAVRMIKSSENESLWIFEMDMPTEPGKPTRTKRCILRAVGQGQQMRGINIDNQRPDFTVVDDVEDNDNTESEFQQKKLDKWIFGPFLKALARKHKILWLGNMLAKTSLLARLSRNPRWNPVVFGSLVRDTATLQLEPLWPGKWSVAALQEDFKEYKDNGLVETWMCEMMNMPGHGENGFTLEQINYVPVPNPDQIVAAWITIDPAFGMNAHNDETSIAVHVLPKQGIPRTVCVEHGRFDEHTMFNKALHLAQYWGAWTWGIESVAAQKVLITLFNMLAMQYQLNHQLEFVPLTAGKGDPKAGRIRAFVSQMANGEWGIPEGDIDITTQIVDYDFRLKEQPDDIVDSVAYGPTMLELYKGLIMAMAAGEDVTADSLMAYGTELCDV
jgi:hypothetical protein